LKLKKRWGFPPPALLDEIELQNIVMTSF